MSSNKKIKVRFSSVAYGSTAGPNHFGTKLRKYFDRLGYYSENDPDVTLCFLNLVGAKTDTVVQRLDGIWFNPRQDYRSMNSSFKSVYDISTGIIFQSCFDRDLVGSQFGTHNKSTIINNGADLELISQITPLESTFVDDAEKVWCCASHFAGRHHKRLYENIRYFMEHSGEKDVLFVAGAVDTDNFSNNRIKYVGNIDVKTLLSIYKRADYFIHLAKLDHCPNVVVDARGSGCQIICSSLGGTKEVAGLDAIVIEEDEWDFVPFDYNQPTKLDFSKKIQNTFDRDISMKHVAKKYYEFLVDCYANRQEEGKL